MALLSEVSVPLEKGIPSHVESSSSVSTKPGTVILETETVVIESVQPKYVSETIEQTDTATAVIEDAEVIETSKKVQPSEETSTAIYLKPEREESTMVTSIGPSKTARTEEEVASMTTLVSHHQQPGKEEPATLELPLKPSAVEITEEITVTRELVTPADHDTKTTMELEETQVAQFTPADETSLLSKIQSERPLDVASITDQRPLEESGTVTREQSANVTPLATLKPEEAQPTEALTPALEEATVKEELVTSGTTLIKRTMLEEAEIPKTIVSDIAPEEQVPERATEGVVDNSLIMSSLSEEPLGEAVTITVSKPEQVTVSRRTSVFEEELSERSSVIDFPTSTVVFEETVSVSVDRPVASAVEEGEKFEETVTVTKVSRRPSKTVEVVEETTETTTFVLPVKEESATGSIPQRTVLEELEIIGIKPTKKTEEHFEESVSVNKLPRPASTIEITKETATSGISSAELAKPIDEEKSPETLFVDIVKPKPKLIMVQHTPQPVLIHLTEYHPEQIEHHLSIVLEESEEVTVVKSLTPVVEDEVEEKTTLFGMSQPKPATEAEVDEETVSEVTLIRPAKPQDETTEVELAVPSEEETITTITGVKANLPEEEEQATEEVFTTFGLTKQKKPTKPLENKLSASLEQPSYSEVGSLEEDRPHQSSVQLTKQESEWHSATFSTIGVSSPETFSVILPKEVVEEKSSAEDLMLPEIPHDAPRSTVVESLLEKLVREDAPLTEQSSQITTPKPTEAPYSVVSEEVVQPQLVVGALEHTEEEVIYAETSTIRLQQSVDTPVITASFETPTETAEFHIPATVLIDQPLQFEKTEDTFSQSITIRRRESADVTVTTASFDAPTEETEFTVEAPVLVEQPLQFDEVEDDTRSEASTVQSRHSVDFTVTTGVVSAAHETEFHLETPVLVEQPLEHGEQLITTTMEFSTTTTVTPRNTEEQAVEQGETSTTYDQPTTTFVIDEPLTFDETPTETRVSISRDDAQSTQSSSVFRAQIDTITTQLPDATTEFNIPIQVTDSDVRIKSTIKRDVSHSAETTAEFVVPKPAAPLPTGPTIVEVPMEHRETEQTMLSNYRVDFPAEVHSVPIMVEERSIIEVFDTEEGSSREFILEEEVTEAGEDLVEDLVVAIEELPEDDVTQPEVVSVRHLDTARSSIDVPTPIESRKFFPVLSEDREDTRETTTVTLSKTQEVEETAVEEEKSQVTLLKPRKSSPQEETTTFGVQRTMKLEETLFEATVEQPITNVADEDVAESPELLDTTEVSATNEILTASLHDVPTSEEQANAEKTSTFGILRPKVAPENATEEIVSDLTTEVQPEKPITEQTKEESVPSLEAPVKSYAPTKSEVAPETTVEETQLPEDEMQEAKFGLTRQKKAVETVEETVTDITFIRPVKPEDSDNIEVTRPPDTEDVPEETETVLFIKPARPIQPVDEESLEEETTTRFGVKRPQKTTETVNETVTFVSDVQPTNMAEEQTTTPVESPSTDEVESPIPADTASLTSVDTVKEKASAESTSIHGALHPKVAPQLQEDGVTRHETGEVQPQKPVEDQPEKTSVPQLTAIADSSTLSATEPDDTSVVHRHDQPRIVEDVSDHEEEVEIEETSTVGIKWSKKVASDTLTEEESVSEATCIRPSRPETDQPEIAALELPTPRESEETTSETATYTRSTKPEEKEEAESFWPEEESVHMVKAKKERPEVTAVELPSQPTETRGEEMFESSTIIKQAEEDHDVEEETFSVTRVKMTKQQPEEDRSEKVVLKKKSSKVEDFTVTKQPAKEGEPYQPIGLGLCAFLCAITKLIHRLTLTIGFVSVSRCQLTRQNIRVRMTAQLLLIYGSNRCPVY